MAKNDQVLQEFLEDLNSEATRSNYKWNLSKFLEWTGTQKTTIKTYASLSKARKNDIQSLLENYFGVLKKIKTGNSIPKYFTGIESFLDYYDVNYSNRKLHKKFKKLKKVKTGGKRAYSAEQIQLMIKYAKVRRNDALIKCFTSSGIREGAITTLQLKHMVPINDPNFGKCYLLIIYSGVEEEYVTFMTPEATLAFDDYLNERKLKGEKLTPESFAFIYEQSKFEREVNMNKKFDKYSPISVDLVRQIILAIVNYAKIDRVKIPGSTRYEIAEVHGLRKFYDTALNRAKVNYAGKDLPAISSNDIEKLMGHRNNLKGLYYDPENLDLFQEYKKAIPYLTIDAGMRKQEIVKEKEARIEELERIKDQELYLANKKIDELESKTEKIHLQKDEMKKYIDQKFERLLQSQENEKKHLEEQLKNKIKELESKLCQK